MSDLINKRGGCSIHGAATCFQSRAQPDPGGLGPLIVRADLGNMAIVDFPEKKIDKAARGFRGFPPDASFSPFLTSRKGVPKHTCALWRHERIENRSLLNGFGLRGHRLSSQRSIFRKRPTMRICKRQNLSNRNWKIYRNGRNIFIQVFRLLCGLHSCDPLRGYRF